MAIDNLKSGVSKACRYELGINPTYQEITAHYVTADLPARVRKPRDKAKAEVGIQLCGGVDLGHPSLVELNQAICGLLARFNNRPFKKLPGNRGAPYTSSWTNQRSSPCPLRPINMPNGRKPRSTSIATWR
ncbi:hypothetical protein DFAR_630083 [Desulfarculales bacterium]